MFGKVCLPMPNPNQGDSPDRSNGVLNVQFRLSILVLVDVVRCRNRIMRGIDGNVCEIELKERVVVVVKRVIDRV